MCANFVGNTLTLSRIRVNKVVVVVDVSEVIKIYTLYDITSPRPRKTTLEFFGNFGRIEKLFCTPDQSLNSKIMNQCTTDFNFLEKKGAKISFHWQFKERH